MQVPLRRKVLLRVQPAQGTGVQELRRRHSGEAGGGERLSKFSEKDFVKKELDFLPAKEGDSGFAVRRLQEWMCLNGHKVVVDGQWGPATSRALGVKKLTPVMWESGTRRMKSLLGMTTGQSIREQLNHVDCAFDLDKFAPILVARMFLQAEAREVGGNNRGPWVRLFMRGHQGNNYPWCAGFVSTVMEIVDEEFCKSRVTLPWTWSSSEMYETARKSGRLVTWNELSTSQDHPACVFLIRGGKTGHRHAGFAWGFDYDTGVFETVEGNSNSVGSFDGQGVTTGTRNKNDKDFVLLD